MHQTQAERVVAKFGGGDVRAGLEVMVQHTEHPYKRIWNWLHSERGEIPQNYHQGLLDDAARITAAGITVVDLLPYDFVAHLHRPVAVAADLQATG